MNKQGSKTYLVHEENQTRVPQQRTIADGFPEQERIFESVDVWIFKETLIEARES